MPALDVSKVATASAKEKTRDDDREVAGAATYSAAYRVRIRGRRLREARGAYVSVPGIDTELERIEILSGKGVCYQSMRSPSWINRGFALLSLVMLPAVEEVGTPPENCRLAEGRLKLTWLRRLKKSARN